MTPTVFSYLDVTTRSHASLRLSNLAEYGLVKLIVQGFLRLTDDGRAFLDEGLDASALEPVDESD